VIKFVRESEPTEIKHPSFENINIIKVIINLIKLAKYLMCTAQLRVLHSY